MRQFSRLFHQAVAGITKPVTLHFLRHSFAARDTLQASAHRGIDTLTATVSRIRS